MKSKTTKQERNAWSKAEVELFQLLYLQFKKDFQSFVPHIPGRSKIQIKSFFYNHLELVQPKQPQLVVKEDENKEELVKQEKAESSCGYEEGCEFSVFK